VQVSSACVTSISISVHRDWLNGYDVMFTNIVGVTVYDIGSVGSLIRELCVHILPATVVVILYRNNYGQLQR